MAQPRQKLASGIDKVCFLLARAAPDIDLVNEAWAAVRMGIVASRQDDEGLDARSEEEMRCVLEFLVQRGLKKRAARGQVKECLRIVLARPPWLASAHADEVLRTGLLEVLEDGEAGAELRERLAAAAEEPAEEAREAWAAGRGPEECPAAQQQQREDQEVLGQPAEEEVVPPEALEVVVLEGEEEQQPRRLPSVRERLAEGVRVMRHFGWQFPHDPTGVGLDEATAGFRSLLSGVTALTTSSGRASVGEDVLAALTELDGDWPNVLQFLLSMYTSGVRSTYSSRIRFVVVKLRDFSPAFRGLMPWESLPWGHLPMPALEAEEARQLEELQRRGFEEREGLRLARALQAQEEADAQAFKEVRGQLEQEDWSLARSLQDEVPSLSSAATTRSKAVHAPRGLRVPNLPRLRRRSAGGA
eukprot:CAMPEP_0179091274 /NCGR_PEP_ID=MMETSP0796-20121207/41687_1 /TAXON_ID=73915 /ORGANISM="Pyrodinium bahamense, Strain pbaha01" /LENGTH=415 /DNA_ID=CAMNT_0020788863 /DNA_START=53 /DNA_END=1300 /DNA_ORIENTATION=+